MEDQWRMMNHLLTLPLIQRHPPLSKKHPKYQFRITVSARLLLTPILICVDFVSILPDLRRGRGYSVEDIRSWRSLPRMHQNKICATPSYRENSEMQHCNIGKHQRR